MPTIKKILVPTDLSELSEVGVRYALEMAVSQGAEAGVLYVGHYQDVMPRRGYEASLDVRYETVEELLDGCKKAVAEFLQKKMSDLTQKVKVREQQWLALDSFVHFPLRSCLEYEEPNHAGGGLLRTWLLKEGNVLKEKTG